MFFLSVQLLAIPSVMLSWPVQQLEEEVREAEEEPFVPSRVWLFLSLQFPSIKVSLERGSPVGAIWVSALVAVPLLLTWTFFVLTSFPPGAFGLYSSASI